MKYIYVVVNCSKLDTIFISMYKPLSTDNSEWIEASVSLDKDLKNAQAYGNFQHIFRGGDFNFLT